MKRMMKKAVPQITLDCDQANEVVVHELMWHLTFAGDTDKKTLKAMHRTLQYFTSEEEYQDFLRSLDGDWRYDTQ